MKILRVERSMCSYPANHKPWNLQTCPEPFCRVCKPKPAITIGTELAAVPGRKDEQ